MIKEIKRGIEVIMDLIYPKSIYCMCCGKIIDNTRSYSLCDHCVTTIRWATGRTCQKCGKPIEDNWLGNFCANCMENRHAFQRGITCTQYGLYERTIVFQLKYTGKTYIAEEIAKIMRDRLALIDEDYEIIVPVPVSKKKLKTRGFNQAELIGQKLAKYQEKPIKPMLKRSRETVEQRGLGASERRSNIAGAFTFDNYFSSQIKDRKILLLDDIYTTGATADECAKVLLEAGASSVDVLTFAASGNRHMEE